MPPLPGGAVDVSERLPAQQDGLSDGKNAKVLNLARDAGFSARDSGSKFRIIEQRMDVARRMFFTIRSDGDSGCTDFCLISTP